MDHHGYGDYATGGTGTFLLMSKKQVTVLGFITPLSHGFCESCNRMRLTCKGVLYMCLGQDGNVDLREIVRASESDETTTSSYRQRSELKAERP